MGMLDTAILEYLFSIRTDAGLGMALLVTFLGSWIAALASLALFHALWGMRDKADALGVLSAFLVSLIGQYALKAYFAEPRPPYPFPAVMEHSFAFPSGHATTAAVVYGFFAILVYSSRRPLRHRLLVVCALMMAILAVGASRLYLGVHVLSDVLAGFALGGACAALGFFVSTAVRAATKGRKRTRAR